MANIHLLHLLQHTISIFIITFTSLSLTNAQPPQPFLSPLTSLPQILTSLGYTSLATASHSISLSSDLHLHLPLYNPITVFAATDTSLRTCHSCSLPLLLKQHSLAALYPFSYLQNLLLGTKIETLDAGHCLTITSTAESTTVFVNGVQITHPNLYVSNTVIIHGIQGFISHLSPYSCLVRSMNSLSVPQSSSLIPLMIDDAMIRLRTSGLTVLALALRVKSTELSNLHNMTIFSIDDESIFHLGNAYIRNIKYHIIPNQILKLVDLEKLAVGTKLPTLETGEVLTITTAGGGVLTPVRINYVKITKPNLILNSKLVIHGIENPFRRIGEFRVNGSGNGEFGLLSESDVGRSRDGNVGVNSSSNGSSPVMESTVESEYYHQGL